MIIETPALPTAQEAPASGQQTDADLLAQPGSEAVAKEGEQQPGEVEGTKPEKTEAEREKLRMQRGIDRKTRQAAEARAERDQLRAENERLRASAAPPHNRTQQDDEPLTLSRADLDKLVNERAEKLAPTLSQERKEIEHRKGVIEGLAKDLGQERFDDLAADLDEALGGIQRNGRPTPATEAIFSADDPKAVIQYLADPDNADEAETIGRLDAVRVGRAIAKLEAKLELTKAQGKPQRSNAAEPVEPSKGRGTISNMPDPSNVSAYIKWANEQDRAKH